MVLRWHLCLAVVVWIAICCMPTSCFVVRSRRSHPCRRVQVDRQPTTTNTNLQVQVDETIPATSSSSSAIEDSKREGRFKPPGVPDAVILALVPVIWGAYSPVVKGLYSAPNVVAPPPLVFNLLSYMVSLAALTVANKMGTTPQPGNLEVESRNSSVEWRGGVELGLWLFLGSTVQITGIQTTTAISAAVLVQTTTILVPLLDSLLVTRGPVPLKLWLSCIVALIGVVTVSSGIGVDGADGSADAIIGTAAATSLCTDQMSCTMDSVIRLVHSISFNQGDLLVLLSAVFYSMHVIRLGNFASRSNPVKLAQVKSFTELCASMVAILALYLTTGGDSVNEYIQTVLSSFSSITSISSPDTVVGTDAGGGVGGMGGMGSGQLYVALAVGWNGFFSTALTTWAQSVGQRSVPPTTANLLYSSQPIWAALFSYSFLGESLGPQTVLGSSILLGAILYSLYEPPKGEGGSRGEGEQG